MRLSRRTPPNPKARRPMRLRDWFALVAIVAFAAWLLGF
jgi:hypothetical protein